MTISEVAEVLSAEILVRGESADRPIRRVVASDLMSDVLLVDDEDMLLLTSLSSDQVLRTAQIVGAVAVVVVNGKPLSGSMTQVARDLGVSLLACKLAKYEACVRLHAAHPVL